MGRAPCCDKANVKRGPWSPEEDTTLKNYLEKHGTGGNWIALPHKAGLKRCGKSCRLRWLNYLRPDIKHGGFTDEEDKIICSLYRNIGSKWSIIASHLPGRTDNDVKNYWNTKLKKKQLAVTADLTSNPLVSVVKREDICYSHATRVGESSSKLQLENVGYECNVDYKRLLSDPAQFPSPEPPRLPEFCKNESSSIPMDSEFDNYLMDFGYGSGLEVPEKMGEIPPNLVNFSYVNLLANCESTPQGLFKRVSY